MDKPTDAEMNHQMELYKAVSIQSNKGVTKELKLMIPLIHAHIRVGPFYLTVCGTDLRLLFILFCGYNFVLNLGYALFITFFS